MSTRIHLNAPKWNRSTPNQNSPTCEWEKCDEHGTCRAPKSRRELNTFRWFCKKHARQYNLSWNYYAGMTDEEVEDDVRRDTTWQRPSWKLGSLCGGSPQEFNSDWIIDPFNLFADNAQTNPKDCCPDLSNNLNAEQRHALSIFQLTAPISEKNVKAKYKELVKLHHPDAYNSSSQKSKVKSEEKIKDINQAYQTLIEILATP